MKIAAISDIHLDINKDYDVLGAIRSEVESTGSDVLIVAGDIAEDFRVVQKSMEDLERTSSFRLLYVPGNHDLWSPDMDKYSTDYIYASYMGDERCLSGKTAEQGDVAFIGDVGWFDYSFGNHERFTDDSFDSMSYMGRTWQDKIHSSWTENNKAACALQLRSIEASIAKAGKKKIVAVTHMLPVREFTVLDARPEWEFFNAFLGSEKLGCLFEEKGVSVSVSGHVHYRKEIVKNGIRYICPCLGYESEWKGYSEEHANDVLYHVRDSLKYFEL